MDNIDLGKELTNLDNPIFITNSTNIIGNKHI